MLSRDEWTSTDKGLQVRTGLRGPFEEDIGCSFRSDLDETGGSRLAVEKMWPLLNGGADKDIKWMPL
ncbi:hypothetical protein A2U01_0046909 [Trifolium medium]|uniref:Uncharacterized protein n=1 Tax=Trifolium medium TaxID=97028 RepID=A0A392QNB1_9FABA|nr:hypothetical protein [Trifolium medium]